MVNHLSKIVSKSFIFSYYLSVGTVLLAVPDTVLMFCFIVLNLFLVKKKALPYLSIVLIMGILNFLFSHTGETVLFYFAQTKYTLEALIYGLNAGLCLFAVSLCFICLSDNLSSADMGRIVGSVFPRLGTVLSMSLRSISRIKTNAKEIKSYQENLGISLNKKGFINKLKSVSYLLEGLIIHSFEESMFTAQSMAMRGAEIKVKNKALVWCYIIWLVPLSIIVLNILGVFPFVNINKLVLPKLEIGSILSYVFFCVYVAFPVIFNVCEERKWNY